MMAPDSKRVMFVFGSVMAGTRPLGLMDSKGSAMSVLGSFVCFFFLCLSWGSMGRSTYLGVER